MYASFALSGNLEAEKARELVGGWQLASGGWRPAAELPSANWTTSLALLLTVLRRDSRAGAVEKGLEWLGNNREGAGWAWRRRNPAAVEPTALALLSIRLAGAAADPKVTEFLLADELSPETCGPALVGLQGSQEAKALLPLAARWRDEAVSPLTRAWIGIGLRLNGGSFEDAREAGGTVPRNLAVVALEALSAAGGNHELLQVKA